MTDPVAIALISAFGSAITAAISGVTLVVTRNVRNQAVMNWQLSHANYEKLHKIQEQTNGNVTRLLEAKDEAAMERERIIRQEAYEAGRRAEMKKTRRATDPPVDPANDEEPKE